MEGLLQGLSVEEPGLRRHSLVSTEESRLKDCNCTYARCSPLSHINRHAIKLLAKRRVTAWSGVYTVRVWSSGCEHGSGHWAMGKQE